MTTQGFKGFMPIPLAGHDNTDEFPQLRFLLTNSWNTSSKTGSSNPKRIVTPFRAVNNAGDLLSRDNYSCGTSSCQYQSRPNLKGIRGHFGAISNTCTPSVIWSMNQIDTSIPPSNCNGKYVYDSSDYTRFKKQQAINRNFNDISFGGNEHNASQSVFRRIRRY